MPGEINLADYEIDVNTSGNLVIKDSTGTTVLTHTDGGDWTFGANVNHGGNNVGNVGALETGQETTDKLIGEQRLDAVYQANDIRAQAGVPSAQTVGLESGVSAGLADAGSLTADSRIVIASESDASTEAASGSGTESDPYIIENKDLDNSEASTSEAGFIWDDSGASYYITLRNCEIRGYDASQISVLNDTSKLVVEDCLIYANGGGTDLIDLEGGGVECRRVEFAGGGNYAVDTSTPTVRKDITLVNCTFTESQEAWNAGAVGIGSSRELTSITVQHCAEQVGALDAIVDPNDPSTDGITIENTLSDSGAALVARSISGGRNAGLTIRYCECRNAGRDAITFANSDDVLIEYCTLADSADGFRLVDLNDLGLFSQRIIGGEVRYCKFTDTTGTGGAGNECCETTNSAENVDFHHCWVTECSEDAFEHAYSYRGCDIHHVVADNCTGQIVDFFGAARSGARSSTGEPIDAETHHIYGDTTAEAVLVTDCDSVTVRAVHAQCDVGVELEQRNGTAGATPTNCSVNGPLPLAEVVGTAIFQAVGDVGANNRVLYLDQETQQTPLAMPYQTEYR